MNRGFFFRLDASPEIGVGHLRRCSVLAQECLRQGWEAHLLIRQHSLSAEQLNIPEHAKVHLLPWDMSLAEDAAKTIAWCQEHQLCAGVVDHYRFDEDYQRTLNEAGLKWMQFGNHLHSHPLLGALMHDATPGANIEAYRDRLPTEQPPRFLTGPAHALVGEPFVAQRTQLPPPSTRSIESILLTFGGGNDRGATLTALEWLEAAGFPGRRVVLTTSLNPNLPQLQDKARADARIELQIDNWQPAAVMARCQLALCAGGTSLHELACLGVPPIIIGIADNQLFPAKAWAAAGLAIYLGMLKDIDPASAVQRLHELLGNPETIHRLAMHCWNTQDGRGAERVAHALQQLTVL